MYVPDHRDTIAVERWLAASLLRPLEPPVLGGLAVLGFLVRDKVRDTDNRVRAQASRVRLTDVRRAPLSWAPGQPHGAISSAHCTVWNRSDDVISRAVVSIVVTLHVNDKLVPVDGYSVELGRLDPDVSKDASFEFVVPEVMSATGVTWTATADCRFVDAAGRKWWRDAGHKLHSEGKFGDRTDRS